MKRRGGGWRIHGVYSAGDVDELERGPKVDSHGLNEAEYGTLERCSQLSACAMDAGAYHVAVLHSLHDIIREVAEILPNK